MLTHMTRMLGADITDTYDIFHKIAGEILTENGSTYTQDMNRISSNVWFQIGNDFPIWYRHVIHNTTHTHMKRLNTCYNTIFYTNGTDRTPPAIPYSKVARPCVPAAAELRSDRPVLDVNIEPAHGYYPGMCGVSDQHTRGRKENSLCYRNPSIAPWNLKSHVIKDGAVVKKSPNAQGPPYERNYPITTPHQQISTHAQS